MLGRGLRLRHCEWIRGWMGWSLVGEWFEEHSEWEGSEVGWMILGTVLYSWGAGDCRGR